MRKMIFLSEGSATMAYTETLQSASFSLSLSRKSRVDLLLYRNPALLRRPSNALLRLEVSLPACLVVVRFMRAGNIHIVARLVVKPRPGPHPVCRCFVFERLLVLRRTSL